MNTQKLSKAIKKRLPRIKNVKKYVRVVGELNRLGAINKKKAIKTSVFKKIKNVAQYLKNLEKVKIVKVIKKGSARFLLDLLAKNPKDMFCRVRPQIEAVRKRYNKNLLRHIEETKELLELCAKALNVESIDVKGVELKIRYSENKKTDKKRLTNFNDIVKKFKEKAIKLKGYDELQWMRGGYSWYVNPDFLIDLEED